MVSVGLKKPRARFPMAICQLLSTLISKPRKPEVKNKRAAVLSFSAELLWMKGWRWNGGSLLGISATCTQGLTLWAPSLYGWPTPETLSALCCWLLSDLRITISYFCPEKDKSSSLKHGSSSPNANVQDWLAHFGERVVL